MAGAMFESEARGLPLLRRGKVRDVYQPSDGAPAHRGVRPHLGVRPASCPRPSPTRARSSPRSPTSGSRSPRTSSPTTSSTPIPGPQWYPEIDWYYPELDGRTVLVRSDPAAGDRGDRARLPVRLGLEGVPEAGDGLRHRAAGGPDRVGAAARAHLHAVDQGAVGPRREHLVRAGGGADRRRAGREGARHQPGPLPLRGGACAGAGHHHRRHQVRVRAPGRRRGAGADAANSSSSTRCSPPTPPASGRPTTYEPGRAQASYDKQYVRDYLEAIKWNKEPPAPVLPAEVVEKTREKYWEAVRRLTA